jgi:sugar phosphate isomerase/epimerase
MKRKTVIGVIAMVGLAAVIGALPARGDEGAAGAPPGTFIDCINREIDAACAKVGLAASRSEKLKAVGIASAHRLTFMVKHREALAQEMAERGVPMRAHAVHQRLLHRVHAKLEMAGNRR